MTMYDELIKRLRLCAEYDCHRCEYEFELGCRSKLNNEAADAIEQLSKELIELKLLTCGCCEEPPKEKT